MAPRGSSAVLTVPEVAELLGSSPWTIYEAVKRDEFPVPVIRLGKKILFSRTRVYELLGVEAEVGDGAA